MKHIHYRFIVGWAKGRKIQVFDNEIGQWIDCPFPSWGEKAQYRFA